MPAAAGGEGAERAELADGAADALRRYVRRCREQGIVPEPLVAQICRQGELNLADQGLGGPCGSYL